MGGLLGVVGTENQEEVATQFAAASERMLQLKCNITTDLEAHRGLWRFQEFESRRLRTLNKRQLEKTELCALFHGVVHNVQHLWCELGEPVEPAGCSLPALLVKLYSKYGKRFVQMLHGEFCIAIADSRNSSVLIATDTVGNHPLYWHQSSKGLCFSSSLSAALRACPSPRYLDLRAVADYITLGF